MRRPLHWAKQGSLYEKPTIRPTKDPYSIEACKRAKTKNGKSMSALDWTHTESLHKPTVYVLVCTISGLKTKTINKIIEI